MAINRILIATDYSPDADAAVESGLRLAQQLGATVDVVHVLGRSVASRSSTLVSERRLNAAKGHLRRSLPRIAGRTVGVGQEVLLGDPGPAIVEFARRQLVDAIVLGATGAGSARTIGHVASHVVRESPCPVLTLRGATSFKPPSSRDVLVP
jgi:nucleotide-binding universal stress UspA family protein